MASAESQPFPKTMETVLVMASFGESLLKFRGPLLAALVARGCRVVATAPEDNPLLRKQLSLMGVEYRSISMSRTGLNPLRDLETFRQLRNLCLEIRPDVTLAYTIKPVVYGCLAARQAGVPHIHALITGLGYSFVGSGFKQRFVNWIARRLYRWALAGIDTVFFQNPDDRDCFIDGGLLHDPACTVLVNGSGVDLEHYTPSTPSSQPSFLMISRLIREKGVREYAEAARRIRARHPSVQVRLAGWIDEAPSAIRPEELESWQSEFGLEYLGLLKDVRPALAEASIYVLPSYREGTPRTVLEAMATGRAIITTDAPGCRETVMEGKNGFLVPVQDVDALCTAMERFILDMGLIRSMGLASLEFVRKKFDVRNVNAVILDRLFPSIPGKKGQA